MNSESNGVLAILQARMTSTRLPGKVMAIVNKKPLIEWQIQRILRSKSVEKLVVATSIDRSDDILVEHLNSLGVDVYRGDLKDVFSRFALVLESENFDSFFRLTADCPLVMSAMIDEMASYFFSNEIDYLSNFDPPTFPDGMDIEIVSTQAFLRLKSLTLTSSELEHVTIGLRKRPDEFRIGNFTSPVDLNSMRWTVDYPEDLVFISRIFHEFRGKEVSFDYDDVLDFLRDNPDVQNKISGVMRNVALKGDAREGDWPVE